MAQGGRRVKAGSHPCHPNCFSTPSSFVPEFPGNFNFHPGKSGRTNFRPEFFWIFQIPNRKNYGRRNFNPKIFTFFNFRAINFPEKRISRPEKVRVSVFHNLHTRDRFTTVGSVSCQTYTFFSNFRAGFFFIFQLSTGKFSGISDFEPDKIRRKNFRGKKNRLYQLSS